MPLRRRAALLATAASTLAALTALGGPAQAASADPAPTATGTATGTAAAAPAPTRADLYGAGDPTYDGVWRQSYAIRAVNRSGYFASTSAVGWLLAQQCADGGWPSYRPDTAKPCDPKTEDTNATGEAVDTLRAMSPGGVSRQALDRGQAWLRTVQNADGGWSYNPGGPSDPDSTAIALGALGEDAAMKAGAKGRSPYEALRAFQFGCAAEAADRGAFGYPGTDGKLAPNAKATADALSGMAAANLTTYTETETAPPTPKAADCTADPKAYDTLDPHAAAFAAADWLAAQLRAGGGHLDAVTPGSDTPTPDYGTTADAAAALAVLRPADAKAAYTWLAANAGAWAKGNPAALAQLIFAADAVQGGRTLAGGADPVAQLIALGPAPTKRPTGAMTKADSDKGDASSSSTTWIIVGAVFVASAGAGILLSGRKRRRA